MTNTESNYHHGNLRQALLDCAETHLREGGAQNLSLRALAREIGVSQTAPYRHFKDKDELLAALAIEGFERFFAMVEEHALPDDVDNALLAMGKLYVRFANLNPELFRLMYGPNLQPRSEYPQLFNAGRDAFQLLKDVIRKGSEQGEFRDEDVGPLGHAAWAGVHGVAVLSLDHAESFGYYDDLEAQTERSLRIMIAGLHGIGVSRANKAASNGPSASA